MVPRSRRRQTPTTVAKLFRVAPSASQKGGSREWQRRVAPGALCSAAPSEARLRRGGDRDVDFCAPPGHGLVNPPFAAAACGTRVFFVPLNQKLTRLRFIFQRESWHSEFRV
ncbi:hypothetical protein NDU88_006337 [Pleurodeles waltl]|uniref:Uncharacterized protein n=1 Tax=Pleurodeles waltl TaxID=8319 RepID=A0AAV7WFA7_PLEWA|nr:hypothetical protein NDU88_006337 [Pleurodeles waltl]